MATKNTTAHSPTSKRELSGSFDAAQARLVVQSSDLPLGTLAEMVESGAIDLQPSFQRRERWDLPSQSALIESFLLNVPVPPIYLSEEKSGTYTAIDGKQRLNAIHNFIYDKIVLANLEGLPAAEGYRFSQLPSDIQNALKLRPFIRIITLLKQTHSELKYEVFLRLNRGGERLNAQEIRNVAYRGALNDAIYDLASNSFLKTQLKIRDNKSPAYRKMEDAEYVLRFVTLMGRWTQFGGKMAKEMDQFMEAGDTLTKPQIAAIRTGFNRAIDGCQKIWGAVAFQRPEGNGWRDQLLAGMYDAQMLAVSELSDAKLENAFKKRKKAVSETRSLFKDASFEEAVRTGTNTPSRIQYRTSKMRDLLANL